jgi:PAS domain S-box-containing protein
MHLLMSTAYKQYLQGGGEMGALTRAFNWSDTQIGPPQNWSQSLLTAVSILLNSRFPMFLWWGEGLVQFYNDAYRPSLGKEGKHPTALGQRGEECWQEIWPVIYPLISQVMAGGESSWSENHLIPIYRNGELEDVYWTFSYSRVNDESGKPGGVLVICTETTQQVTSFNELKQAKMELDFAIEAAELGTWDLDPATNTFIGNERLKLWFGISADAEIALSRAIEVIAPDDRDAVLKAIAEAMQPSSTGHYDIEYTIINPLDPSPRLVRAKGKALFDADGVVYRFSGTMEDITSERSNQLELAESNQRLEMALDAAMLGSYDLDVRTGKMNSTPQFKTNFGKSPEETFDLEDLMKSILPAYRSTVREIIARCVREKNVYVADYPICWPDGSIHWIRAHGKPEYDTKGRIDRIIGVAEDITGDVTIRKELERVYEQARLSKQAAQMGTFDMDLENETMEWDERCRTLFGISHSDEVTYEHDFLEGLHSDDNERVRAAIDRAFNKLVSNGDYDVEYRTIGQEDQKLRWVKAKGKVYFSPSGLPIRFIGSVLDITEQKLDELRKNDFIGMVSHELKTPLTTIKAYTQVGRLLAESLDNEKLSRTLERTERQIRKMTTMINGFLNVSRFESGKIQLNTETFDIDKLISETVSDLSLFGSSHQISYHSIGPTLLQGDSDKIASVLSNLIGNAIKYSPATSLIEIICTPGSEMIEISVSDNGPGIKVSDQEKLFERYYRVEDKRMPTISGFGIGLYLSAEIVRRHNGTIGVKSEPGEGATFYFSLPLHH